MLAKSVCVLFAVFFLCAVYADGSLRSTFIISVTYISDVSFMNTRNKSIFSARFVHRCGGEGDVVSCVCM